MPQNNLKQKAASGMVWTSIRKFVGIGISFISGIILARLLTPHDYGCIGMLSIFMMVANSFIDGGFASALIQKKRPTQEDYSTVFFFNLCMSILMYAILFVSAPAISQFYRMPILCSVLRVQGLVLIINAFSIIQSNQLTKQFRFKKLAIIQLSTSVIVLSVTIYMAYKGFGVWALVASNLISAFIPAVVYWLTNKWYPLFVFSKSSFKELFNFGFFMFLTHIINNICNNIQGLLIGRFYSPTTMGYYSKAQSTEVLASHTISDIVGRVTYPLYAEYQDNKQLLSNVIKRFTSSIAYITFPMMSLLILLAEPVFILLYSDRWLNSVPYFQILCLSGIASCLQGVNYQAIAAVGRSKAMFTWTLIKRGIAILLIVSGLALYGMKGLLIGMVFQGWFVYLINAFLVQKYIGYKLTNQFLDLLPVFILAIISFGISYCIVFVFPNFNIYVLAIIRLLVFSVFYFGCSVLFKLESFIFVKENLPLFMKKSRK